MKYGLSSQWISRLGYSAIVSGPEGKGNKGFVANEFNAIFYLMARNNMVLLP
jgi:hypothetical protein